MRIVTIGVAAFVVATSGAAQESPYLELQEREIKALSSDDVAALLAGDGMGFALAAELNGFPGPRHVLDLADSLGLDALQLAATRAVFDTMQSRARALGAEIVRLEAVLDSGFANRAVDAPAVTLQTVAIGRLHGQLRAVHLSAHLEMMNILREDQIHRYQQLRGYHGGHRH